MDNYYMYSCIGQHTGAELALRGLFGCWILDVMPTHCAMGQGQARGSSKSRNDTTRARKLNTDTQSDTDTVNLGDIATAVATQEVHSPNNFKKHS